MPLGEVGSERSRARRSSVVGTAVRTWNPLRERSDGRDNLVLGIGVGTLSSTVA